MKRIGSIKITDFALRHFDPKFGGTKISTDTISVEDFEEHLNGFKNRYYDHPEERFIDKEAGHVRVDILPGEYSFSRLLVMANITQCKTGSMPITIENSQYLRRGYSARRPGELPVLSDWIDLPYKHLIPRAKYTVAVLYSKEQIDKEAMRLYKKSLESDDIETIGMEKPEPFGADWGVVAILGQMNPKAEPMKPITMMRNALGIEEGGNGEPIDKESYERSVKYWETHATVR